MKTLLLAVAGILISLAAMPPYLSQSPQGRSARYFGDQFAQAQRELALKPVAEMPQAF